MLELTIFVNFWGVIHIDRLHLNKKNKALLRQFFFSTANT